MTEMTTTAATIATVPGMAKILQSASRMNIREALNTLYSKSTFTYFLLLTSFTEAFDHTFTSIPWKWFEWKMAQRGHAIEGVSDPSIIVDPAAMTQQARRELEEALEMGKITFRHLTDIEKRARLQEIQARANAGDTTLLPLTKAKKTRVVAP